jgi:hypothetical protein
MKKKRKLATVKKKKRYQERVALPEGTTFDGAVRIISNAKNTDVQKSIKKGKKKGIGFLRDR